jgi:protein-tyrosine-phosphatase
MAEALLRHEAGERYEVFSAGAPSVPKAVPAMREIRVDISEELAR